MTSSRDALEEKTVDQLKEMLRSKGLTVSGVKAELVQRLLDAEEKGAGSKDKKHSKDDAHPNKDAAGDKSKTGGGADEDGKAVEKEKCDDDAEDNRSDEEKKEAASSKDEKDEGDKDEKKDEDDKVSAEGDSKEKADGDEDEKAEGGYKNDGEEERKKDGEDDSEEKKVTKMDKLNMSLDDLISADHRGGKSRGRGNDWGSKSSDWKAADNKWADSDGSKDWKKADKYSSGGGDDDKWKAKEDWTASWKPSGGGDSGGAAWQSKSADSSSGQKSNDWKSSSGGAGNEWVEKDTYKKKTSWDAPKDKEDWKSSGWVDQKAGGGGSSYTKSYDSGSYSKNYSKYDNAGHDDRRRDREPSVHRRAPREEPRPEHKSSGQDKRTILVAGIAGLRVDRRDLERAFSAVGRVESCSVASDVARITYEEGRSAADAVRRFHGGQLNDRTIDVYFEGEEPPRPSGGRGGRSRSRGKPPGAAPSRGGGGGGRRDGPPRSRTRSRQRRGSGGGGAIPARSSRDERGSARSHREPERRPPRR